MKQLENVKKLKLKLKILLKIKIKITNINKRQTQAAIQRGVALSLSA